MRGAFQVAKFFNIPVRIHWTFPLIILWVVYESQRSSETYNWIQISFLVGLVLLLFTCVVLHEFGHALAARRFGVNTMDIIISPIGGVARLDRMPEKPLHEFWVAIAGPAVNFVIILILGIFLIMFRGFDWNTFQLMFELFANSNSNFNPSLVDQLLINLLLINLVLALFNLLPAFPLDGGRIFRSLLSIKFGRLLATRIAVTVGQIFAVALLCYGLWESQFITAFIGIFVFSTAASEYRSVKWDIGLNKHLVKDIMVKPLQLIQLNQSIREALNLMDSIQTDRLLVLDSEREFQVLGTVTKKQLQEIQNKAEINLAMVLNPLTAILTPNDSLRTAYNKMHHTKLELLPVIENGELIATLSLSNIERFIKQLNK